MKINAFIFARGGSKGVPRKNIRQLGGVPLLAHSIKQAHASPSIDRVIVSTDDKEIAEVAMAYGAEVPFMRPAQLAGDRSSEFEAWKHAVEEIQGLERFDLFVSLPATSPLRSVDDIENCIKEYIASDADVVVTVKEASRSPYFNMLKVDGEGYSQLVITGRDGERYTRRQDVPEVYDMTTVAYVTTPEFILSSEGVLDGRVRSVIIPDERAIDIDTPLDFEIAEFLYSRVNHENN